jgi:Mycobacterium membrane protein
MNRPYSTYSATSRTRRTGGVDDAETDLVEDYDAYDSGYESADDEVYEYVEPFDRRWTWVAGAAGAVLLVAVICTVVILGGGDSGSVSATVSPPAATSTPVTTQAPRISVTTQAPRSSVTTQAPRTSARTAAPLPTAALTPETVTTVAPAPSVQAAPSTQLTPPTAPSTITYQVTGNRQLIDLVTIIYTDGQGALQTELNVALPWTKSIALDPGVTLGSVTATSITGHLNCTITNAAGAVVAAQTSNSLIANCTK